MKMKTRLFATAMSLGAGGAAFGLLHHDAETKARSNTEKQACVTEIEETGNPACTQRLGQISIQGSLYDVDIDMDRLYLSEETVTQSIIDAKEEPLVEDLDTQLLVSGVLSGALIAISNLSMYRLGSKEPNTVRPLTSTES